MNRLIRIAACLGLVAGAVVSSVGVAPAAVANALPSTSPPSWSAPALADHQAPFADASIIEGVSCLAGGECFAVDNAGRVLTTADPAGGLRLGG